MRVRFPSGAPIVVAVLMAAALLAGRETTPQACDANHTIKLARVQPRLAAVLGLAHRQLRAWTDWAWRSRRSFTTASW